MKSETTDKRPTTHKGPATELIHAGESDRGIATPLTTPIYETTTFVFDSAEEVLAYNEGRSQKYLYLPVHQPDGRQRRMQAGRARPGGGRAGVFVGAGRHHDDPDGAHQGWR